jgi:hypothetical protein
LLWVSALSRRRKGKKKKGGVASRNFRGGERSVQE